jgi:hypothetical protein
MRHCVLSIVLSTVSLLAMPATSQTVYRCGNSYSQAPCAGGQSIDASDSRDKTQKAQTDAAIRRDLKAAEILEKNRSRQDAGRTRAPRLYPEAGGYDIPLDEVSTDQGYENGRKNRKPEFFTAKTAAGPIEKHKRKKSAQHRPPQHESGGTEPRR